MFSWLDRPGCVRRAAALAATRLEFAGNAPAAAFAALISETKVFCKRPDLITDKQRDNLVRDVQKLIDKPFQIIERGRANMTQVRSKKK